MKTSTKTYDITVSVVDYLKTYGNKVMDDYVAKNFANKSSMTDNEILQTIAKFPASFDYSKKASNVYAMIATGGGDCWASTDAIISICKRLGITAWERDENRDQAIMGGHQNAMVELNGKYYEVEAAFDSAKENGYREYTIDERDSLFDWRYGSNATEAKIVQYDGPTDTGDLVVPDKIGDKTVVGICQDAFRGTHFSSISMPNTINNIESAAFAGCPNLKDISFRGDNPNIKIENQSIYSGDGKTLIECPIADRITIPESVTNIYQLAFAYNNNIRTIRIPKAVTDIAYSAFEGCENLKNVYFYGNEPSVGTTINNIFYDDIFRSTNLTAYYPKDNSTWKDLLASEHGGTVTWKSWTPVDVIGSLDDAKATLNKTTYNFTNKDCEPTAKVELNGKTLTQGVDYSINYENNKLVGTAKAIISGIGAYEGELECPFTIQKGDRNLNVVMGAELIDIKKSTKVSYSDGNGYLEQIKNEVPTYQSKNPAIATVDASGNVTGKAEGTTEIVVRFPSSTNYNAATYTLKIEVLDFAKYLKKNQTISASNKTKTIGSKSFYLGAKGYGKLTYKSSNTKVATISSSGKVYLKGVGATYITVKAAGSASYNAATKTVKITVNPKGTYIYKVTNVYKKKAKVTWKKGSSITGYEIQYATKSSMKSAKTATITKYKTTKTNLSKLTKNKYYYVRIRTYKTVSKKKYYSGWSSKKKVKIRK